MDAIECITTRRSVRRFSERPVPRDVLAGIVSCAACAPSWKNSQTVRYVAVEDRDTLCRIADSCVMGYAHNTGIIRNCPLLIVQVTVTGFCGYDRDGKFTTSKGDRWESYDAGVAAQTFCLAAHDKGLGTVIMGIFDEEAVSQALQLPPGRRAAALIAVGYPAEDPGPRPRLPVSELLTYYPY